MYEKSRCSTLKDRFVRIPKCPPQWSTLVPTHDFEGTNLANLSVNKTSAPELLVLTFRRCSKKVTFKVFGSYWPGFGTTISQSFLNKIIKFLYSKLSLGLKFGGSGSKLRFGWMWPLGTDARGTMVWPFSQEGIFRNKLCEMQLIWMFGVLNAPEKAASNCPNH